MSDTASNKFIAYGTAAQRGAFTPAPATIAAAPFQLYLWYETDTGLIWGYDTTWHNLSNANGAFSLASAISPAALGADQNDYNPTGLSTANAIRLSASIATVNITGLSGGATGRLILVFNVGASNNLVLKNESVSSLAANRFDATGDVTLAPSAWTLLWYDGTSSRWRVLVSGGGGGGGGTVTTTGAPANGNLTKFSGATSITNGDLSGDVTTSGTLVTTLATVTVPKGGTGATTLTAHGLLLGQGTSAVTAVAALGAGQTIVGVASADPVAGNPGRMLITEVVTAASQPSVSFTSIAATWRDLEVRIRGRGDAAAGFVKVHVQFNSDTAANYEWEQITNITLGTSASDTSIDAGYLTAATSPANIPGYVGLRIFDYRGTTFYKSVSTTESVLIDNTPTRYHIVGSGWWNSLSAITRIDITLSAGNFVNGSVVSLYGCF